MNPKRDADQITFGIEIECLIPESAVRAYLPRLTYRGARVRSLPTGWIAKTDASLRSKTGFVAVEIVSPVLQGRSGIESVITAVETLNRWGAEVNSSCGFHCHVGVADAADQDAIRRLVRTVQNFELAIFASTGSRNRFDSRWCRSVRNTRAFVQFGNGDADMAAAQYDRYQVLNLTNLHARPAVEFRAFAGTTNLQKILGHVQMAIALVQRSESRRKMAMTAKNVKASSPIARKSGEGSTALTRLFYTLGWTKGRESQTYGVLHPESLKEVKRTLSKMARKFDRAAG